MPFAVALEKVIFFFCEASPTGPSTDEFKRKFELGVCKGFFVVIGGLAAAGWGANRRVADFDIQIDKNDLSSTKKLFKDYLNVDLRHYVTENWDIHQMVVELDGVVIDICQAQDFYVVKNGKKHLIENTIHLAINKTVQDVSIPVMPLSELIKYKSIIARSVDLQDVAVLKI